MCSCRRRRAAWAAADPVEPDHIEPAAEPAFEAGVEPDVEPDQALEPTRRSRRVSGLSLGIAAVIVVLDQLTKHWAVNALADGAARHVVWTLQWNLTFNSGMAFSRGEGWGPIIGLLAFAVVLVLASTSARLGTRLAEVGAGLLIGGAVGNLVDRLFRGDAWMRGAVVDFIDMQWWPIFNIADMGVTIGAVLFAIAALRAPAAPSGRAA
jgi:signal peptidase II